jgi:hypothetical protein
VSVGVSAETPDQPPKAVVSVSPIPTDPDQRFVAEALARQPGAPRRMRSSVAPRRDVPDSGEL